MSRLVCPKCGFFLDSTGLCQRCEALGNPQPQIGKELAKKSSGIKESRNTMVTQDNDAFIQEGSELIRLTALKMEPVKVASNFILMLTPKSVKKTSPLPFRAPRAVIPFDINKGAKSLHGHTITRYGEKTYVNVYEAGIKFPGHHGHYQKIVEVAIFKIGLGKMSFGNPYILGEERLTRLNEAYGYNRYWFAIPSSRIHIEKYQIRFSDREYARRFAEFNHLEGGVWETVKQRTIGMISIFASAFVPFFFVEWLWERVGWWSIGLVFTIGVILMLVNHLIFSKFWSEPL